MPPFFKQGIDVVVKEPGMRKPRADAARNRIRLMAVAKEAFAQKGTSASLDDIARAAIPTMVKDMLHFPKRYYCRMIPKMLKNI